MKALKLILGFVVVFATETLAVPSLTTTGSLCVGQQVKITLVGCTAPAITSWDYGTATLVSSGPNYVWVIYNTAGPQSAVAGYTCNNGSTAGETNPVYFTISAPVTPTVSPSASTASGCGAFNTTIYANSTYPGTNPAYMFTLDGSSVLYSGSSSSVAVSTTGWSVGTHTISVSMVNQDAGCFTPSASASGSTTVTVGLDPPIPNTPTVSMACGTTTVSFNGSPPPGVTWYWVSGAGGFETWDTTPSKPMATPGTLYLKAKATSYGCWSSAVSVTYSVNTAPSTPNATISDPPSCGSRSVAIASDPSGVSWYWQDNANGTSFLYGMTSMSFVDGGTNWIRAYSNGCWSSSSQQITIAKHNPDAPATPVSDNAPCGPQILSYNGAPLTGVTWYWQGTNSDGYDYTNSTATAATFLANASTTYYIRARNTAGCWSGSTPITVTLTYNPPPVPPALIIPINTCTDKILTKPNAPAGVTYYWELNSGDQDVSTAQATASTFAAKSSGTYFLRAKYNNGPCWSTRSITVDVNPVDITVNSYDPLNPIVQASHSITFGPGFYVPPGSPFDAIVTISPECNNLVNWTETIAYDQNGSPISDSRSYSDGFGVGTQSQTKDFLNGKIWGTQTLFNTFGKGAGSTLPAPLLENGFIYKNSLALNASGQPYSAADFDLRTLTGAAGEINNPKPMGTQAGTTGWYYSSSNNLEGLTPTTQFPYSRSYTAEGPDPTNSVSAGPGDAFRMGGGHNPQSDRYMIGSGDLATYLSMRANFPNAATTSTSLGYKYVTTDANGKKAVSFVDADGRSLATAIITGGTAPNFTYDYWSFTYYNITGQVIATISPKDVAAGGTPPATTYSYDHLGRLISVTSPDEGTSQFVYSTDGKIRFSQNQEQFNASPNKKFSYTNYDYLGRLVESGEYTSTAGGYVFEPHNTASPGAMSVLNIIDNNFTVPIEQVTSANYTGVSRKTDIVTGPNLISNWDFGTTTGVTQYYASGPPTLSAITQNGKTYLKVVCTQAGGNSGVYPIGGQYTVSPGEKYAFRAKGYRTNSNATSALISSNIANIVWGSPLVLPMGAENEAWVTWEFTIPNNGTTWISVGLLWSNSQGGVGQEMYIDQMELVKVTGSQYDNARCSDYSFITYDVPGSSAPATQSNLYGQISKTENANSTAWYSYDEDGLLVWLKQNITGLGLKSVDYTYDYFGNVTMVAYQAGQSDVFYHHYDYDINQRLVNVYTSFDGVNKTLHSKYKYYLHGGLKRMELGGNLQGLDYVYTIDGSLKSINHSDVGKDPGGDGANGFAVDAFGETFNYFDNDYTGANYSAGTFASLGTSDQFNGMIKAQSWFTPVDNPSSPKVYGFTYDNLNQLTNAQFGSVSGTAGSYTAAFPDDKYREGAISYDKNGNIQALLRKGKTANTLGNYAYNYTAGTNKVAAITNNAVAMMSYTYNTIGQMTQQIESGVGTMNVAYNAYGLVKEVRNASNVLLTTYTYDDRGNKLSKTSYNSGNPSKTTYYVSDAGGTTLAIYDKPADGSGTVLLEVPIYGSGRIAVYKPGSSTTFYEINDNLGNVRAVIGKPGPEIKTATYETSNLPLEEENFLRVTNAKRVQAAIFDHTNGTANGYSERLNGSTNEKYGIARSLGVQPGDTIKLEVYGKYVDTNASNWTGALTTLMGQISSGTAGVVIDGSNYANSTSSFPWGGLNSTTGSTGGPKAYLNWLIFDKNYTFISGGYTRMSAAPKEQGQDVAHERLYSPNIVISQPGYLYTYLSNEETTPIEVFFDDFKVTHVHSKFVAGSDYYPYGMVMNDRAIDEEPYRFGYQGQYSEKDPTTGWNEFDLRMYDSRFGRWLSPDPMGQFASPYVGMGNNPESGVDSNGGFFDTFANAAGVEKWFETAEEAAANGFTTLVAKDLHPILVSAASTVSFDAACTASSFSGTYAQYQAAFPHFKNLSYAEAVEHWKDYHSDDFYRDWGAAQKYERGQIAVQKMAWFALGYSTAGSMSLGALGNSFGVASPKSFNYTPRGSGALKYDPRLNGQTDLYHNFPRLYDEHIIQNGARSLRIKDAARWFEMDGSVNGIKGTYQIGINKSNTIFHRNFVELQKFPRLKL